MPVQTPSELANTARCYDSCIPRGMQRGTEIYLLSQLVQLLNPTFDVTPSNLAKEARCFNSCIPAGMEGAVTNYLLNQFITIVSGGGGGGGGGGVFSGNFIGNGPPPDTLIAPDGSRYTDRLTAADWYYDAVAGGWVPRSI